MQLLDKSHSSAMEPAVGWRAPPVYVCVCGGGGGATHLGMQVSEELKSINFGVLSRYINRKQTSDA